MECQDATARIAEYLVGSLRVEELEGLLTHAAACATCRDELTEAWRQLGRIPPAEFDAVLAGYKDGLSHRPRNIRPPQMRHLPSLRPVVFLDLPSPIHCR